MDEFLACSDLCEENQFQRQAELLRLAAGNGGKVYVVAERSLGYNDENYYVSHEDGTPQTLFLDRAEAERAAESRNGQRLRQNDLGSLGNDTGDYTSLDVKELERRVRAILGTEFELFPGGYVDPTPFPADATDEQMTEVARLFDRLEFYHVVEVEFAA